MASSTTKITNRPNLGAADRAHVILLKHLHCEFFLQIYTAKECKWTTTTQKSQIAEIGGQPNSFPVCLMVLVQPHTHGILISFRRRVNKKKINSRAICVGSVGWLNTKRRV